MPLQITARHLEVTDRDREYLQKKLPRLERICGRLDEVAAVFIAEKKEYIVEINLRAGAIHAFVKGSGESLMAAIDLAVDKLQTQVSKTREKKFGNKMHATESIRIAEAPLEGEAEEET